MSAPFDDRPLVHCGRCATETFERPAQTMVPVIADGQRLLVPGTETAPRMMMKPKGEPCPRCGDNSPHGTFPPPETSGWARFGEGGNTVVLYSGPAGSWCGTAEEYAALCARVKASKKKAAA